MRVQLIRTSYDRKSLEKICCCVISEMEVNEEDHYRPVVEVLYQNLKDKGLFNKNRVSSHVESTNMQSSINDKNKVPDSRKK